MVAKARAAELRLPMRRFIEEALASAINVGLDNSGSPSSEKDLGLSPTKESVWDDQYLAAQARQPVGTPLALSEDEARRVALEAFDFLNDPTLQSASANQERIDERLRGSVGDPVEISDEDAEELAREALMLFTPKSSEVNDG